MYNTEVPHLQEPRGEGVPWEVLGWQFQSQLHLNLISAYRLCILEPVACEPEDGTGLAPYKVGGSLWEVVDCGDTKLGQVLLYIRGGDDGFALEVLDDLLFGATPVHLLSTAGAHMTLNV